jgi:hypothetical protein
MRGEGGSCGVSAIEYRCTHHVTWSPNKLWRSTSIFNLCGRTAGINTHLGHDESLLEVGVDPAGRLGRLCPLEYGPGLHLIRPSREEVLQLQRLVPLHRMEQRELRLEYGLGLHLIRPSREEVLQLQRLVPLHGMDHGIRRSRYSHVKRWLLYVDHL